MQINNMGGGEDLFSWEKKRKELTTYCHRTEGKTTLTASISNSHESSRDHFNESYETKH